MREIQQQNDLSLGSMSESEAGEVVRLLSKHHNDGVKIEDVAEALRCSPQEVKDVLTQVRNEKLKKENGRLSLKNILWRTNLFLVVSMMIGVTSLASLYPALTEFGILCLIASSIWVSATLLVAIVFGISSIDSKLRK